MVALNVGCWRPARRIVAAAEGCYFAGSLSQGQRDMPVKLFIPQETIDAWLSAERANLEGDMLRFSGTELVLRLVPGCYFKSVQAGSDQGLDLLGKVKAKPAISALGAETCMNSVILGETAYEVEVGFVAKPVGGTGPDSSIVAAIAGL